MLRAMSPIKRLWTLVYRAERIAFREGVYADAYVHAAEFAYNYAVAWEIAVRGGKASPYLRMRDAAREIRYAIAWGVCK